MYKYIGSLFAHHLSIQYNLLMYTIKKNPTTLNSRAALCHSMCLDFHAPLSHSNGNNIYATILRLDWESSHESKVCSCFLFQDYTFTQTSFLGLFKGKDINTEPFTALLFGLFEVIFPSVDPASDSPPAKKKKWSHEDVHFSHLFCWNQWNKWHN